MGQRRPLSTTTIIIIIIELPTRSVLRLTLANFVFCDNLREIHLVVIVLGLFS